MPSPYSPRRFHAGHIKGQPIRFIPGHENRKHGHTGRYNGGHSLEYRTWEAMKQRCLNPKHPAYDRYGGRGITVCARWLDLEHGFENFLADMGTKPEPKHNYSIERKDNNGSYTPSNCKLGYSFRATTESKTVHKTQRHIYSHDSEFVFSTSIKS